MKRTLLALQINFHFSSVCVKYVKKMPFGNSDKISSDAMERLQNKQNILPAYDKISVKICIPNG